MDRRTLLSTGAAATVLWASPACAARGGPARPEDFGARGDGRANDTAALQRCFDKAGEGATVQLRQGAVYRVDTNVQPTFGTMGGLRLRTGQVLDLNGGELKALPSPHGEGAVVQAHRANGWRIVGPGRIVGERDIHRAEGGEWGMGVASFQSHDWAITPGVEITNCWGDGIYVGTVPGNGAFSERFLIDGVRVFDCRRNGISIVAGRDGEIRGADIVKIDGTNPRGGIDLEPDHPDHYNRNIRMIGCRVRHAQVGVYIAGANRDVLIADMDIEVENSGVIIGEHCSGVRIERNRLIRSTLGGAEGAAIRTAGDSSTMNGIHIIGNQLSGGGFFVIDMFDRGYRDLRIERNRMIADNPGTQGIARIGGGTFKDNDCVIGPRSGKNGDYFVYLLGVEYGGNRYRNDSPHAMYSAIGGGSRELAPDDFQSRSLVRYTEP